MTGVAILWPPLDSGDVRENLRGIPMALETRTHCKLRYLLDDIHVLHRTVAFDAVDLLVHVNTVIEVRVVRHFVDSFPRHRGTAIIHLPQLDDVRLVLPCDGVTSHARREGRDSGMAGRFHGGVTISTIDRHRSGMKFVRKSDRLGRCIAHVASFGARGEERHCERSNGDKDDDREANLEGIIE